MSFTRLNASAATLTKNRTEDAVCPVSGMCTTCIDGCLGMCEIGKSAIRGSEVIYPQPFGIITAASQKDYPVDLSHFNIMGTAVGAIGMEGDSDKAIFPKVNLETKIGQGEGIKMHLPFSIPGLGSTDIAKNNWEGLAIGAAISGTIMTVGENVCGMDVNSKIVKGKVVHSPDLSWRVKLYKDWQKKGYGTIAVQTNVEDTKLGVLEYAISKLKVDAVELKWGQGAKDIGGEVKIKDLKKAQLLKKRGYIVLPNPLDLAVIKAFKAGAFKEFERHSRIGMVREEDFVSRVKELRKLGAKYVFLKTGAYRPADLARAVKYSSIAKIDLLTVDGAGGGTGMSPWRMM
ncbi:FMN-binding glutamate synthase family protein, partial [bacterium]|nr:FMN-binding glutamate synthase family protein [bacterium]